MTQEVLDKLFEGLQVGMTYEGASTRAGISDATRLLWYTTGKAIADRVEAAGEDVELTADEDKYLKFFRKHDEAIAEGQYFHWVNLENHSPTRPDVSQWILQNRHGIRPPAQRHEITGADGGPIETKDAVGTEERTARIIELLDAARARRDRPSSGGGSSTE